MTMDCGEAWDSSSDCKLQLRVATQLPKAVTEGCEFAVRRCIWPPSATHAAALSRIFLFSSIDCDFTECEIQIYQGEASV